MKDPSIRNLMIQRLTLTILIMLCTRYVAFCQHREASRYHCPELEQLHMGSRVDGALVDIWMKDHRQLPSTYLPVLADIIADADQPLQHTLLMVIDECMDTLYYVNLDGYLDSADTPQRKGVAIMMLIAPKMTFSVPDGTGSIHYENFGRLSTHAIDVVLSWLDKPCPAIDMTVFIDPQKNRLLPSQLCPRTINIVGRLLWMYCGEPILNGRSDWARGTNDNDDVSPFPVDAFKSWYRDNRTHLVFDWKKKSFGRHD